MRAKLIVGNWKMNGSFELIDKIFNSLNLPYDDKNVDIVICPPDVLLCYMNTLFEGSGIYVGAQNVHSEEDGAFTGETSAHLLKQCGVGWCIVGHSERREFFGETDDLISRKMEILLKYGIIPIFCVGESYEQRKSGDYEFVVVEQLRKGLSKISSSAIDRCVIAYEPVWAIGTGMNAEPKEANNMHKLIRKELVLKFNNQLAQMVPIIYGGSVNPENAETLISMEEIDGALVGGASLLPDKFKKIIELRKKF